MMNELDYFHPIASIVVLCGETLWQHRRSLISRAFVSAANRRGSSRYQPLEDDWSDTDKKEEQEELKRI